MADRAEINRAVFDADLLAVVEHLIPPERVQEHLRNLDWQFNALVNCSARDATLRSRAHKIVSQAGMLGLGRMSECARQVEAACRAGRGQQAALLNCCDAIADVRLYAMPAAGNRSRSRSKADV